MTLNRIFRSGCSAAVMALMGVASIAVASAETVTTDDTSLTSPPGCYTGTGCVNSGFEVTTDGTTELGLTAILRYVGPQPQISGNTYTLPAGTSGAYAAWDYTFSINTQYNGGSATLSDYTYLVTLTDLDNSTSTSFNPLLIPDNTGYGASGKVVGSGNPSNMTYFQYVANNEGTLYGAENSENFSFTDLGTPGFNPNVADDYEITLTETNNTTSAVTSDTIYVDIVTPEPGTFLLLGGGLLAGLIYKGRRKA